MINFDPQKMIIEANKAMKKEVEESFSNDIRKKFPDIKDFSVSMDINTAKVTFTGLTEDQISQLDNVHKQ